MDLQLDAQPVLLTGAARGIGAATARSLAREGARLLLVDKDPDPLAELARSLPNAVPVAADLTHPDTPARLVQAALDHFNGLHALVHNAGVNDAVGLDAPPEAFLASLHRNLLHVFALTHHARRALIASRGAIVNVSSKVAETGQGGTSGYAAAKGALNALTREWAVALAPHGVRVNAVIPAECDTDQYRRWFAAQPDPARARSAIEQRVPLGHRLTTPEEVADTIVFLLSPRAGHMTGQLVHVDGGYTHLDRGCTTDATRWS